MNTDRVNFINGLRELASFLEAHPVVPIPGGGCYSFNTFVKRENLLALGESLDHGQKLTSAEFLILRQSFGQDAIRYEINAERILAKAEWDAEPATKGTE